MQKIIFKLFLILGIYYDLQGQDLENIPPVLFGPVHHKVNKGLSLILCPAERLEIIDAAQPWPPRWFAPTSYINKNASDTMNFIYENARLENHYFAFYSNYSGESDLTGMNMKDGFIVICNEKLEPVDTIRSVDSAIDSHDFAVNAEREALVSIKLDTVLNMSGITGNMNDTAVKALIDIFEVLNSNQEILFAWNPVQYLGVEALYIPYGDLKSRSSKEGYVDWSHVNALDWDFDGNILYCFRHIGIGKIARDDGHIIWRFDRNKVPYISGTNTLAFYLQHAFKKADNFSDYSTYTLYSNGDSSHAGSFGLEIAVDKKGPPFTAIKKQAPAHYVIAGIGGNYTILTNGDYILNYGLYTNDTDDERDKHVFMEYGKKGKIYAEYCFDHPTISFTVHPFTAKRPPRPKIIRKNNTLIVKGNLKDWTWYQLSGPDNTAVNKVGEGVIFTPNETGLYCVAGKYGIGYSVSLPVEFNR